MERASGGDRRDPVSSLAERVAAGCARSPRVLLRGRTNFANPEDPVRQHFGSTATARLKLRQHTFRSPRGHRRRARRARRPHGPAATPARRGPAVGQWPGRPRGRRSRAFRSLRPASSARSATTWMDCRPRSPATWMRKLLFRRSASSNVISRSGRRIAMTIPGTPPPDPTSITLDPVPGTAASSSASVLPRCVTTLHRAESTSG